MKKSLRIFLIVFVLVSATISAVVGTAVTSEVRVTPKNISIVSTPAIYGDIVVWSSNYDIYGYNLKTGTVFPVYAQNPISNGSLPFTAAVSSGKTIETANSTSTLQTSTLFVKHTNHSQ